MDCSIVMISKAEYPKRLRLLKNTILSLRKRTCYPYELIVVDNGPQEQTDFLSTCELDKHIINKENLGMGRPRNQGAGASDSKHIAFIDNDLIFQDGWLTESIGLLKWFEDEKIIIAPMKTIPMKKKRNQIGELDGHTLWSRAGSGCLVFRRRDYEAIGPWANISETGREYGRRARAKGYSYLLLKEPKVRHIGRTRTWLRNSTLKEGKWTYERMQCNNPVL